MGKGSSQRPTDKAAFDSGYERVFGKSTEKQCTHQSATYGDPWVCIDCGFRGPSIFNTGERNPQQEAALQAIVDFSQEHGLYEDMPIENDRIGALFMEAYEKDIFIRMGGKLRADQQSMGTNDEMKDGLYDLFEDVAAKLKYEPLTRSEQHQQLERIVSSEFTGKITTPNQTCGSCKHWEHDAELEVGECHGRPSAFVGDRSIGFRPPADFGCNRWEAKP